MTRSKFWIDAIPAIQVWVEYRFASNGRTLWDYIDGKVGLADMGITRTNFLLELAPKFRRPVVKVGAIRSGGVTLIAGFTVSSTRPATLAQGSGVGQSGRDQSRYGR